uniref:Aldehyde ferredoxin oxidoreductase N-terminal domain-containing protein n=1 Tax=candidate division WWE3 bacterium TaxID=2053526 RepID=A0A7C4XV46_UNCKA
MNLGTKKVLYIDLSDKAFGIKLHNDLSKYIGGVGLGAKLLSLSENAEVGVASSEPVIFSIGPLNGYYPYASKTSVLFRYKDRVMDQYLGGNLSTRIKFAGIDSIVISGRSKVPVAFEFIDDQVRFYTGEFDINSMGLPGKRAQVVSEEGNYSVGNYFASSGDGLNAILASKNLAGFVVTGTQNRPLPKSPKYQEIFNSLLARISQITVEKDGHPSCAGCPVGCSESKFGEIGGNVLVHSLVACAFAENIYGDPNTVFSCLDALGSGYTHEDIENFPKLVYDLLEELKK